MTKKKIKYTVRDQVTQSVLCTISVLFILFGDIPFTHAQVKVYPIERKEATAATEPITSSSTARTKGVTPLSLPFWDDFSFTPVNDPDNPDANYPLPSLWTEQSRSVWVSNGGVSMPSHHVVSFDGLNRLGLSYSDVTLANGLCDTLQSQPIDLSAVPVADRNTVWLSFFYQWKGNGEPPDKNDFIRLQFLSEDSVWVNQLDIYPKPSFDPNVFYDTIIQVKQSAQDNFFHDEFQFRFLNRGRKTGPFDTWNLDYIYLNKGRTITSRSFPDRTMASGLGPLFRRYYDIPIRHYSDAVVDSIQFDIQSQSDNAIDLVNYTTILKAANYKDGATTINEVQKDSTALLFAYQRRTVSPLKLPLKTQINPILADADSVSILYTTYIDGDEIDPDAPGFFPINFQINDTISEVYTLNNYYAFDDGTAEYSGGVSSGSFLYAFPMLTTEPDTLVGLSICFVPSSLSITRQITLYVHLNDNGKPRALPEYELPYTVKRTGIDEFQYIEIKDPIVVRDTVYIGYSSPYVKVGLDFSHETGDLVFYNAGGNNWVPNEVNIGAMMIRPYFGAGSGGPITGVPEDLTRDVLLYPNPNNGSFTVTNQGSVEQVFDVTGRSIPFSAQNIDETTTRITLQQSPGVYVLKMRKGQTIFTRKVVIRY